MDLTVELLVGLVVEADFVEADRPQSPMIQLRLLKAETLKFKEEGVLAVLKDVA